MAELPHQPPRFITWLLEAFLAPRHDPVIGDLEEVFYDNCTNHGPRCAALIYMWEAVRTIPFLLLTDVLWSPIMFKNYLVIAFRNLIKYKAFSAINIFGLAISMSVCLLIIALVQDQRSYDAFHTHADRIYRVTSEVVNPYGVSRRATSPGPLASALANAAPEVEATLRMRGFSEQVTNQIKTFAVGGLYAEPSFFDLFDFELVRGNAAVALDHPNAIILTEETAVRFFGEANPLGEVLEADGHTYTVTGVLRELPEQTHLVIDALVSFATLDALEASGMPMERDNWNNSTRFYTYLLLDEQANLSTLASTATALVAQNHTSEESGPAVLHLQPLTAINLGEDLANQIGNLLPREAVYALAVLAFLLICTAVFNYISLSVARSIKRAKEIGIRKVVGAHRGQIIRQFLSESVIIALFALGAAFLLLIWLMPAFNSLSLVQDELGISLAIDYLRDVGLYLLFIGFAVVVGMVAGMYPAVVMSRYLPTKVLKGLAAVKGFRGLTLRKTLIVTQFCFAIIGIVTTLAMYQQFSLILKTNYGFEQEQLINVDLQGQPYDLLKEEMMRQPGVMQVAAASTLPVVGGNWRTTIQTDAMDEEALIRFYAVDDAFIEQFRVNLLAGRNFSADRAGNERGALVINRKAVQMLDLGTPEAAVGTVVTFSDSAATVIGVVDDFYTSELRDGNQATVLANWNDRYNHAVVRIQPGQITSTLAAMEAAWHRIAPTQEFAYGFYDDQLALRFQGIRDMLKVIGFVVGFIVFIACLGLLGMASYSAEARVREVGVRKVMGATVRSVVLLLSKDYIVLVAVAAVIATPLAWLLTDLMLQEFANRIHLGLGYFVVGIAATLGLALLTVGSQTLKAGYTNPVDTLRHE